MIRNFFIIIVTCSAVTGSSESQYGMLKRIQRNSDTCGVPKITQGLIVQGKNFKRGSFPWIVALTHLGTSPPAYFCAGTLISRTFVISAAHCILEKDAEKEFLPRDILAIFGAHNLSNPYEPGRYSFSPKRIFIHKEWNHLTTEYDADVSLLKFEDGSIHLNTFVQPICLLDSRNEPTVTDGMVTGWGKSEDSTKIHENIPKLISVAIQTNDKCLPRNGKIADISSERTFCAGLRNGSGVCTGDSGGGLFFEASGVYHLKGIVSASLVKNGSCDVSSNAIYTNVFKFNDWIQNITADASESSILRALGLVPMGIYEIASDLLSKKITETQEYDVNVTHKQNDVVVVLDTKLGTQLSAVQEVITELRRLLKATFNDLTVVAIRYNTDDNYIYQYANGKLDSKESFADETKEDLLLSTDVKAFTKAIQYPFRATATKTILSFRSDSVPYSTNPSKLAAREFIGRMAHDYGIRVCAVKPVTITEPADRAKNIVGFNSNVVMFLNEKKRPNMGSADIASKLKYEADMEVDLIKRNGYVFNLNAHQTDKKKFASVVGYVLSNFILRSED